jgi:hypothetical protein
MKSRSSWILFLVLASVVALCGCRSQDQAAADNDGNPAAMTASQAKDAVAEVVIGHQLAADGTIAADQKGNNFQAGQPVIVALRIGKAPVGTPVTIDWFGPNNQALANDQLTVSKGAQALNFTAKDTGSWGPGDYHADISVGGQKVDTERFSIVAAEKADSGTSKASNAVANVSVGHQLGADGSIAAGQEGKNFAPGQPVFIAMQTGSAPAGTVVEIDWFGPGGQQLGSDQRQLASGDTVIHFSNQRTRQWGLGDYHADVMINGQKADTEHFSEVNADRADQTGSSR